MRRALRVGLLAVLALCAGAAFARPAELIDADCLVCHRDDPTLSMKRGGRTISLQVDPSTLKGSAHARLRCVDCHKGFVPENKPHRRGDLAVRCESCHANAQQKHTLHATLFTGKAAAPGSAPLPTCKGCHGTHDVGAPADTSAHADAHAADLACGRCHREEMEHFERSAHGRAALAGQAGAPRCLTCHQHPITRPEQAGPISAQTKLEQEKLCLSCHLGNAQVEARMTPSQGFLAAYDQSVHGRALRAGNAKAATCTDCHGSHDMAKGFDPGSRASKQHISATCGKCHDKVAAAYDQSVHGVAVARGSQEAPACTDCHGEHTIRKANAPDSPVAPANVSERVCSPCHSSIRLAAKYGIRNDRFKTYSDSFHGLAVKGGSVSAANCASCHGAHDILPSRDPRSSINPAHLAATCGKCHAGASASLAFARGKVHLDMSEKEDPALYWVAFLYTLLIIGTIGGMFAHNAIDFFRKSVHHLRMRRGEGPLHPPASHALYLRMTTSERVQHTLLVVSFVVLVLTGFALRYPETWLVENLHRWSNTLFDLRGVVHRVAGVVLVLASLYHLYYLGWTPRGREFFRDIRPGPNDLKDVRAALAYYLGRTPERPRFGRFSYIEKSEYWALVWGTSVMALTGVVLWFQNPFIGLLSKLGWDVAHTVHFYEAVLATLAILVWHVYFVIFNPDVYPMNLAWFTGKISEAEMEDEHPLELERIRRLALEQAEREGEDQPAPSPPSATPTSGDST